MDVIKMLTELRQERGQLEEAIGSLERACGTQRRAKQPAFSVDAFG